jgi:hypothetical protein
VEGDYRQATLGCPAPGSGLPVPMGLTDPLDLAHPLHLATDSGLVLDLTNPLQLAHPDSDLVLDFDFDYIVPNGSGDDVGYESSKETALQAPLTNQSHHPEDGEVEDGRCQLVADHPCLHAIG